MLEMVAEPELKTKMHNITARYRKEKQKIGTAGGSLSDWDLYKEVESLLAPSKTYNSEGLVVDSVNNINTSESQTSLEAVSPLTTTTN
ncbi:uncharacterized protein LOC119601785 [Lucilia sericata]|uniref:uncharacterized protein LOC119601785 n=1 Tax=Lucilia sericata TaxID=13632 RepID=UPI0018A81118|nr:uncharacterized protein LOC119601785 [Lucilia sericata]